MKKFLGWALSAIEGASFDDKIFEESIHLILILNDKVYFTMTHLYADTFPAQKWQTIELFILKAVYVLPKGPKSRAKATKDETLDFVKSTAGRWNFSINS